MLLISARSVPAILVSFWFVELSCTMPPSMATLTPACAATCKVPFGPLTEIAPDCTWHSTPLGSAMGFLATRDILMRSEQLRDQPDDLAAKTLFAGLHVGHDAG